MNKKLSQNKLILHYLSRGSGLTTFDAFAMFGITRLAARVYDLRVQGYEILEKKIKVNSGRRVSLYSLKDKV